MEKSLLFKIDADFFSYYMYFVRVRSSAGMSFPSTSIASYGDHYMRLPTIP